VLNAPGQVNIDSKILVLAVKVQNLLLVRIVIGDGYRFPGYSNVFEYGEPVIGAVFTVKIIIG
jgi:hypothetical protein